jgi:hypothetical protein
MGLEDTKVPYEAESNTVKMSRFFCPPCEKLLDSPNAAAERLML